MMEHAQQELTQFLLRLLRENAERLNIEPNAELITGEPGVIGVETNDGETFFIEVKPA